MKHLILSFLLLCGTMSFAATPQQYEVAIDDSLQQQHARKVMWTKGAQSEIVSIIGKTGDLKEEGEHQPHTVSFIGAFPEQDPQYTLLVLMKKVPYPSSALFQCVEPMRYIAERIYYKK